jgi:hypothetical protein
MTYGLKFVYFSISCTNRDREREASTTNYEKNELQSLMFLIRLFLN